jgi:hypothetical protein
LFPEGRDCGRRYVYEKKIFRMMINNRSKKSNVQLSLEEHLVVYVYVRTTNKTALV